MVLGGIAFPSFASSDTLTEKRIYSVNKISGNLPIIDGHISDPVWDSIEWQSDFIQHFPNPGEQPTSQTRYAICHDDDYIYVAIEAYDDSPDEIVKRMTRRDDIDGDFVLIDFDSYHDLRTCFAFIVNAGGVKGDYIISNNGMEEDETWDPVWWVKTSIGEKSWFAEMKIPFSQLRFDNSESGIWGLNVGRNNFRKDELSFWQHLPPEAPGLVHMFGELHGMKGVQPRKQAEVLPYAVLGMKRYEADQENPFLTGRENILNAGFDAKIGLTNNMILDLSVNPDFGQVEADPSEVNLSAYETFFEEKRPLFIEGKNIYSFPIRWGGDVQNLFYSRRIGRNPHHYPVLNEGEYAKVPEQTNIIAAAKISGKTGQGTSIGILEAVTAEEFATIDNEGERRKVSVEPLTNYLVGRVSQDINNSNTIIGGIVTSTYRDILPEHQFLLANSATTAGVDFQQFWKDKSYNLKVVNYFSHITGTEEALTELQRSPAHLFQRPDADWVTLDSSRTELSGFGGNIQFQKTSGRLNFMATTMWKSPGLEVNDLGYFRMGDEIMGVIWAGYNFFEPFSIFRRLQVNTNYYRSWDFGGKLALGGYEAGGFAVFKNFWSLNFHTNVHGPVRLNSYLRGGPAFILPGSFEMFSFLETDTRKKLSFGPSFSYNHGFDNYRSSYNIGLEVTYRPVNAINMSIEPGYSNSSSTLQYVKQFEKQGQWRYIFSAIDQSVFSASIRVNITIFPELTIQYWGQPFIAAGDFHHFKYIKDGVAEKFTDRYHTYTSSEITFNESDNLFIVTEEQSGIGTYTIDNPDFHVKEYLSNLVIRWEYLPGSVVYLVWSQSRNEFMSDPEFAWKKDFTGIWSMKPANILLLKFSYRIGR